MFRTMVQQCFFNLERTTLVKLQGTCLYSPTYLPKSLLFTCLLQVGPVVYVALLLWLPKMDWWTIKHQRSFQNGLVSGALKAPESWFNNASWGYWLTKLAFRTYFTFQGISLRSYLSSLYWICSDAETLPLSNCDLPLSFCFPIQEKTFSVHLINLQTMKTIPAADQKIFNERTNKWRRNPISVQRSVQNDSRFTCFTKLPATICQKASLCVLFERSPVWGGKPYQGDESNCDKFAASSCIQLIRTKLYSLYMPALIKNSLSGSSKSPCDMF